jgi:hypothetical protein
MNSGSTFHRGREFFVMATLALLTTGVFFFILRLGWLWLFSLLAVGAVVMLIGTVHYLVWGKTPAPPRKREYAPRAPGWEDRGLDDLPPGIRKRMEGNLNYSREDKKTSGESPWWD